MDIQVQASRTPNSLTRKITSPCHIIVKIPKVQSKKRILNTEKGSDNLHTRQTHQQKPQRPREHGLMYFSPETKITTNKLGAGGSQL
jgi:hypothetical protein